MKALYTYFFFVCIMAGLKVDRILVTGFSNKCYVQGKKDTHRKKRLRS